MLEVKIEWHKNYWNRLNGINWHSNWPHPVCFLVSICCCNVNITFWYYHMVTMGFLPDIRLRMHHGTCVTHIPWCMLGSITSGFPWSRWQGKCPSIPGACATSDLTYLLRAPYGGINHFTSVLRPMLDIIRIFLQEWNCVLYIVEVYWQLFQFPHLDTCRLTHEFCYIICVFSEIPLDLRLPCPLPSIYSKFQHQRFLLTYYT